MCKACSRASHDAVADSIAVDGSDFHFVGAAADDHRQTRASTTTSAGRPVFWNSCEASASASGTAGAGCDADAIVVFRHRGDPDCSRSATSDAGASKAAVATSNRVESSRLSRSSYEGEVHGFAADEL